MDEKPNCAKYQAIIMYIYKELSTLLGKLTRTIYFKNQGESMDCDYKMYVEIMSLLRKYELFFKTEKDYDDYVKDLTSILKI